MSKVSSSGEDTAPAGVTFGLTSLGDSLEAPHTALLWSSLGGPAAVGLCRHPSDTLCRRSSQKMCLFRNLGPLRTLTVGLRGGSGSEFHVLGFLCGSQSGIQECVRRALNAFSKTPLDFQRSR